MEKGSVSKTDRSRNWRLGSNPNISVYAPVAKLEERKGLKIPAVINRVSVQVRPGVLNAPSY